MAMQAGALRDALVEAGASPDKAGKASEEVAGFETRLSSMDARLTLLTWMVGFNLLLTVSVLFKLLHG